MRKIDTKSVLLARPAPAILGFKPTLMSETDDGLVVAALCLPLGNPSLYETRSRLITGFFSKSEDLSEAGPADPHRPSSSSLCLASSLAPMCFRRTDLRRHFVLIDVPRSSPSFPNRTSPPLLVSFPWIGLVIQCAKGAKTCEGKQISN